MALCAINVSVNVTEVITKAPEKLSCAMKKFPTLKKGVDKAVACLKDDVCEQQELKKVEEQGSESLEFRVGKVSEGCNEFSTNIWTKLTRSIFYESIKNYQIIAIIFVVK